MIKQLVLAALAYATTSFIHIGLLVTVYQYI